MRIAAVSLDGVIRLVRIRADMRAPLLVAEAAVKRAIERERTGAQWAVPNRGLEIVPKTAEAGRFGLFSLRRFRRRQRRQVSRMGEAGDGRREESDSKSLHDPPTHAPTYHVGYIAPLSGGKGRMPLLARERRNTA